MSSSQQCPCCEMHHSDWLGDVLNSEEPRCASCFAFGEHLCAKAKDEEREACAKLLDAEAETLPTIYNFTGPRTDGAIRARIKQLAMAIRARGEKT